MTNAMSWRRYPWIIALGMSVVIAVNIGMITAALRTFPGTASGGEGFDLSNRYNAVIERTQQQASLGWTIEAVADAEGHPALDLKDATGAPLTGASIAASVQRPVGAEHTTMMAFHEVRPGRYAGDAALPLPGQWLVLLTASARGHEVTATRRIVVK